MSRAMLSLALVIVFISALGCGSGGDEAAVQKQIEALKTAQDKLEKERDDLKRQLDDSAKKKEAESRTQTPPAAKPPAGESKPTEKPEPARAAAPDPPEQERARRQGPERAAPESAAGQDELCRAVETLVKRIETAQAMDNSSKRLAEMDAALEEFDQARPGLGKAGARKEAVMKVYLAAHGLKLNAEAMAKHKGQDRDSGEWADRVKECKNELRSLCGKTR